ncbi:hypothetical protein HOV93_50370 [Planctomycetes bacterium FF15]|uniref:DUF1559 domain-containing protein n=1 Tax=Bremerella alba TaxID=980252 RepID=A0A7V9AA56_9BACT|nr:hypothetical protein [Bremerella alba]
MFHPRSAVPLSAVTDGTTNTIAFGEIVLSPRNEDRRGRYWNAENTNALVTTLFPPNSLRGDVLLGNSQRCVDAPYAPCLSITGTGGRGLAVRSVHPTGANILLVDGSVRFVSNAVNQVTYKALGSRNGGEVLGEY